MEGFTHSILAHHCRIRSFTHKGVRIWVLRDIEEVLALSSGSLRKIKFEDYEQPYEPLPCSAGQGFRNFSTVSDFGLFRVLYTTRSNRAKEIRRAVFHSMNEWVKAEDEGPQPIWSPASRPGFKPKQVDEVCSAVQRLSLE